MGRDSWGYTYCLQVGRYYKIGHTTDLYRRIKELQVGNASTIKLIGFMPNACADQIEIELRKHFDHRKVRGEWFKLTPQDVKNIVCWLKNGVPCYIE